MSNFRLARALEIKYSLISESAELPSQVVLNVRKEIEAAYNMWTQKGNHALKYWAGQGYDLAQEYLTVFGKLANLKDPDNYDPEKLFSATNHLLGLSSQMQDSPKNNLGHALDMVKDKTYPLNHKLVSDLHDTKTAAATALRYLDDILSKKVAEKLQRAYPELSEYALLGGHKAQKRKVISPRVITDFLTRYPQAEQYGLDRDTLSQLLQSDFRMYFPEERETITTLINAVKRGHIPKDADEIFQKTKKIKEKMLAQRPTSVHNMPEEEAQQAFKSEVLSPNEQWNRQMQERKKEIATENQEEEAAELERQRLAPLIQQRDLEHTKKQEEQNQKKTEEDLLNKYNGLTFERWMRS
jgi:hypothetical protein